MEINFPLEWKLEALGSIVDKSRPISYGIVQTGSPVKGGIPCVRVVDLTSGTLSPENMITTSDEISQSYRRTILRTNDLIFALRGEIGLVAKVPSELAGANLTRGVALIAPNLDLATPNFLLQMLDSDMVQEEIMNQVNGSALKEIPIGGLRKVNVPLPPLAEQRKIAEILSTWDEAIALTNRLIDALKRRKQALMQLLLTGKVRFPEFEGEEWKVVELGELGACIRGVNYKPETDLRLSEDENTIRLLRANNIVDGSIDLSGVQFVNNSVVSTKQLLHEGDIAICMSSGSKDLVGKTAIFQLSEKSIYTVGAFCAIFRTHQTTDRRYVSQLMLSDLYRKQLQYLSAGSSINNLRPMDIEELFFEMPVSTSERLAIAEILGYVTQHIDLLATEKSNLEMQKRGLMQRLLTGAVRVKEANND